MVILTKKFLFCCCIPAAVLIGPLDVRGLQLEMNNASARLRILGNQLQQNSDAVQGIVSDKVSMLPSGDPEELLWAVVQARVPQLKDVPLSAVKEAFTNAEDLAYVADKVSQNKCAALLFIGSWMQKNSGDFSGDQHAKIAAARQLLQDLKEHFEKDEPATKEELYALRQELVETGVLRSG